MTWNPSLPNLDEPPAPVLPGVAPPQTGNALDLTDALLHVTYQGTDFALDLIEANERLEEILEQSKKAADDAAAAGRPPEKWLWLKLLQEYVTEHGGPVMRPQALHSLWHEVYARFFALERRQKDELDALLGSPPSTPDSTPPAFPPGT